MGVAFGNLGQYEKALDATRESLKLYPENVTAYENLGEFYIALNRFSEARDITAQAQARKLNALRSRLKPLYRGFPRARFLGDG